MVPPVHGGIGRLMGFTIKDHGFIPLLPEVTLRIAPYITTQKATIHQLTTMLPASKNVLFPGHNHPLTTSGDDSSL